MKSIIIDNFIVSEIVGKGICGIRVTPISLAKKLNPLLNIDLLPKKYGSRKNDNFVIMKLFDGEMKFEDLFTNS